MASQPVSIKFPPALAEAADLRARQLGYASRNAYVKAVIRYDLMVQGEHLVTLPLSRMRPEEQDKTDAELLELTKAGKGIRGHWLELRIKELAGERADAVKAKIAKNPKMTS